MEYRFRAKKSWRVPTQVISIFYLCWIIGHFSKRNIEEYPWISISLLLSGFIIIFFCYRELSQKIILTISDHGISYSGNNYLFADKLENITSDQLSKILVLEQEHVVFEKRLSPTIYLIDQQGKHIKNLDHGQWQSLDDLDLEQAIKICLEEKVELVDRSRALEIDKQQQEDAVKAAALGKVGDYFAYASVGLALICVVLAAIDINITLAWGQYEYLIWVVGLITFVICVTTLMRSKADRVALFILSLIFTTVMTFFIHLSLMHLNYQFGEQKNYRFEKVIQNKHSEVWRTSAGEEVECFSSSGKLHDYRKGIVRTGILGVVRIRSNEFCAPN